LRGAGYPRKDGKPSGNAGGLHRQFVRPLRAADLASEAGAAGEETPPRNSRAALAAKRLRTDKRFQPAE
jgi:hypothetical protein